ncbi:MAG: hypothetical protein GQ574_28640 [Crocinitomix sp.]|nr:hypothetical protein [Crocinitomix sp.]
MRKGKKKSFESIKQFEIIEKEALSKVIGAECRPRRRPGIPQDCTTYIMPGGDTDDGHGNITPTMLD